MFPLDIVVWRYNKKLYNICDRDMSDVQLACSQTWIPWAEVLGKQTIIQQPCSLMFISLAACSDASPKSFESPVRAKSRTQATAALVAPSLQRSSSGTSFSWCRWWPARSLRRSCCATRPQQRAAMLGRDLGPAPIGTERVTLRR